MQPTYYYCDLICRMRPRARRHRMTIGSVRQVATLILLAGIGIGAPDGSFAAATPDPAAVVTGLVVGVGRLIGDPGLPARDREREFTRLLQEDCDLPRVSRSTPGAYLAAASAARAPGILRALPALDDAEASSTRSAASMPPNSRLPVHTPMMMARSSAPSSMHPATSRCRSNGAFTRTTISTASPMSPSRASAWRSLSARRPRRRRRRRDKPQA